jgi:4-amino-4-deoxy-L-arabinose transferase-like glycosyltransferase
LAEAALVIGITALAAVLRFVALDSLPPGLYHDEAHNGLDALRVLAGERPIFFEANNGREPLFIYLVALGVRLFGRTPFALRLVSATVGTLTAPATYLLVRSLGPGRRLAALAGVLAACNVWMLSLSRVAFRAGTLPLLSAIVLTLLARGWRTRRLGLMAWAGAACGLCLYTYLAARFVPLALALWALCLLLRERRQFWWRGWLVFGLLALVVAAPLLVYFAQHWQATVGRAAQVSVWNPAIGGTQPWLTVLKQAVRAVGGLIWRGDFIPRHNVPLRPVFDPAMGAAFLVGLWAAVRRAKEDAAWTLSLIWLGILLLPTVLAEGAPHFVRASGILPVVFLFPATGLDALWRLSATRLKRWGAWLLVAALVTFSAVDGGLAFSRHLRSKAVYYNFETGAAQLAQEINAAQGQGWTGGITVGRPFTPPSPRQVLVAHRLWRDWASVQYLCPESEWLGILDDHGDAREGYAAGEDVTLFLWPFEDYGRALALLPAEALITVREGVQERGDLEAESRLLYVAIRGQARHLTDAPSREATPIAQWQDGIHLTRYSLVAAPDGLLTVRLLWGADQRAHHSYTVFRHVLCDGRVVGQLDSSPAQGYYPTDFWRLGDIVDDVVAIQLVKPYVAGRCHVEVGWYPWPNPTRLRVTGSSVATHDDTAAVLP